MKSRCKVAAGILAALLVGCGGASEPAGTFTSTGSMTIGRAGHTATLLLDGTVLVAGGVGPQPFSNVPREVLASAEIFDPATGTFSLTGSMANRRVGHTTTLLPNGRVLVVGGDSAELYDPATGTFSTTGSLTTGRSGHTATLLSNGKVLIIGGINADAARSYSAEIYDTATGAFEATGSLVTEHPADTAMLLPGGKVLVLGASPVFPGPPPIGSLIYAELYDPGTGAFASTGGMPGPGDTATLLHDGKVLVVGGLGYDSNGQAEYRIAAELYDPLTGAHASTGSLATVRSGHTATLLSGGKVLVAGGSSMAGAAALDAEVYDPQSGTFRAAGILRTERYYDHTATLLPNGKVLVAGGRLCTGVPGGGGCMVNDTAELYDLSAN